MRKESNEEALQNQKSRRLARKRDVTMKKTDEEHPFNKRMKLESEQEQEISHFKENSMGLSNKPHEININANKFDEEKLGLKGISKINKDPSMSFKMSIGDLNYIESNYCFINWIMYFFHNYL